MRLAFLGLPSLHSIIEGIANGFFGALASALVPGFLKHGTIATIQHLVALPDPGTWGHVRQLQGDMTYLAAMLMPVTLAVGTLRYWLIGLTGQTHPATAVTRTVWVTGGLVAYPWIVQQTVAATNTLTHAILGFPTVADGLQRIIGVLFGGALLAGAGGVFGAFLVIIGVLFAAGLFAAQVLLTVVLALLIVAGPPLIALSAIPELSHLARAWAHALLATALVPLGWTILFATAGALCLDATSFTGGATGLPGHVAAAFAGLITFVLAVKLPWMLFGELRRLFATSTLSGHGPTATAPNSAPGVERVRAAHARLRSAAFEGVPSLGRSVGRAAGAMGAPAGGPVGAARRGLAGAVARAGILPGTAAAGVSLAAATASRGTKAKQERPGLRERLARAGAIVRDAPSDARAAMAASANKNTTHAFAGASMRSPTEPMRGKSAGNSPIRKPAAPTPAGSASGGAAPTRRHDPQDQTQAPGQQPGQASVAIRPTARATPPPPPQPPGQPALRPQPPGPATSRGAPPTEAAAGPDGGHPGRKVTAAAARETPSPTPEAAKPPGERRPTRGASPQPRQPPPAPEGRAPARRQPRPRRKP